MKVIDLLNKIANEEELPEEIIVMGATYYLCEGDQSGCCYFSEKPGYGGVKLSFDTSVMNEEVEIIEEDKKIEPLVLQNFTSNQRKIARKVNDIIDYINRGEK